MFNKFPKRTGIYHIKDNIEQLELRIYFRHINSLLKLPKFDYDKIVNGEWHGREGNKATEDENEVKIVNIKWQEKLFSASEEEIYEDAKNCKSETQKKYHEWLLEKVAAENNASDQEGPEMGSSRRARRKKRTRKQNSKSEIKVSKLKQIHEIHTYVHEDNFHSKKTKKKNKSVITAYCESVEVVHMFIFAAIDIDTELVHLQWFPQDHMLHIYPDFNSISNNPYFIEIDKDYRHLYAYAIENVSQARAAEFDTDLGLYLQLPEYAQQPHWRTEEERSALFNMPPQRTRRVSLLLELRDAGGFEYTNGVHVRYHIQLPRHTIHEEGLLEASTHSSCISDSGIHHFGYNWQLTLLCEEEHYNAGDLLHIYFEVISIDSWELERIEGYAHLAICLFGASATTLELYRLQCLRPVLSFWSALERFFIGGRRKFDFKQFFGQAQRKRAFVELDNDEACDVKDDTAAATADGGGNGDFHSRYGCRMYSTGFLQLSCQRFTQRNCDLLEPCTYRRSGMTLDDIMSAYREARKRLETLSLK